MELPGLANQTAVGTELDETAIGAAVEPIESVQSLYGSLDMVVAVGVGWYLKTQ